MGCDEDEGPKGKFMNELPADHEDDVEDATDDDADDAANDEDDVGAWIGIAGDAELLLLLLL